MIVTGTLERSVNTQPPVVTVVGAAAATDVLPDRRTVFIGGMTNRYIQNIGANDTLFCLGCDCDGVNVHGLLKAGLQLSVGTMERVSCFSPNGTTISSVEQTRVEQNGPNIQYPGSAQMS